MITVSIDLESAASHEIVYQIVARFENEDPNMLRLTPRRPMAPNTLYVPQSSMASNQPATAPY